MFFTGSIVMAQTVEPSSQYHRITRSDMADSTKIRKVDSLLHFYEIKGKKDSIEYSASRFSNWLVKSAKPKDYLKSAEVYDLVLENNSRKKEVLQQRYYSSGRRYALAGMDKKSIEAYEKAILLISDTKWTVQSYLRIATLYYDLGDYQLSSDYYRQAEQLSVSIGNKGLQVSTYINSYNTLSRLSNSQSREKMRLNIVEADKILENFEISPKRSFLMLRVAGLYYSDSATRDVKEGSKYLLKAVEMAKSLDNSQYVADAYQNLAVLHAREHPEMGIEYSKLGLAYTQEGAKDRGVLYATMGLSLAYTNDFAAAIEHLQKAINIISGGDFQNSTAEEVQKLLIANASNDNLWVILSDLGQTYLKRYEVEYSSGDIDNALMQFGYIDTIFDQLQQNSTNTSSKFLWRRKATQMYSLAIKASYLKKDIGLVFKYMEKNKALVLLDEMRSRNAMMDSKIPKKFIFRVAHLKSEVASLEQISSQESFQSEKLLDAKRKLIRLTDSLKSNYKTYNANAYILSTLSSLEEAKKELEDNQYIVEYHLTSDDGYGLVTSTNVGYGLLTNKSVTTVFEVPDLLHLKKAVGELQTLISRPFKSDSDIKNYQKLSHSIYKKLFPSDAIRASIKGKELKIIADDFLSVIPIEALSLTSEKNDVKYFIEETNCHYSYSITFDKSSLKVAQNENLSFLAVAPVQFDTHKLAPLEHSLLEVDELKKIFKGTSFVQESASKSNFLENQKEHQILHLATHANATDSVAPWIAFNDEKLNLNELYLLNNNASMVVLSACNTSSGELATGEGVLSLARGFFYGGAQSVVSSLWKVDDVATSELMKSFYTQLDLGDNKSQALNTAKLKFLNTHTGRNASPYYWSTFVLTGNTSALHFSKYISLWWYVFGAVAVFLLILWLRKRRTQRK